MTGTEPVLVSAPVVGRDLPGHLGQLSPPPHRAGGQGGEVGAAVSVYSVGRVHVLAPLRHVGSPGSSSCQPTGVNSGGRAWSSPGVVLVDVVLRPGLGRSVHSPELRLVHCGLLAQPAQVYLDSPTDGVAGGAANTAALLVPVAGLPVVTPVLPLTGPRHTPPGGVGADAGGGGGAL